MSEAIVTILVFSWKNLLKSELEETFKFGGGLLKSGGGQIGLKGMILGGGIEKSQKIGGG
jgi:hypothetical protein